MNQKLKPGPGKRGKNKADLTREAYNDIRRMIFLNELQPDQKVAYRDMANRLGMSLTPVVQALKHMEFLGLLRHEPNRGFFVQPIDTENITEAYELREMVEINLIPRVVEQLDKDGEMRLNAAMKAYLKACRTGSLRLRLARDINFHITLAEISNRPLSIRILRYLLDFLYLRFEKELIFSRPQETAIREHQKIVDAIISRQARTAQRAMRDHIRNIRNNVLQDLKTRLWESEEIQI
jgi:DNA-binding GntR family transcriptional regulator